MVTTKKSAKSTKKATVLRFHPEWIKDPAPPFFRALDRASQRQLTAAKRDFANKVKAILKAGQR
jgi:hypothetical protein